MYEKFFGLRQSPFLIVPDPACVHVSGQHSDVISGAVFGIRERKGFVVLTGEAGLGKTTAIHAITRYLTKSNVQCSTVSHPTLNATDFLELAMLNFGLSEVSASKAQRLKVFEAFLLRADAAGRNSVLIVDEAHKLPIDALEEIRLLGNLETPKHKLLQVLLAGQPELDQRLDQPELWQLKQRVALRLSLTRLTRDGVETYIKFRWKTAGGDKLPFDDSAMAAITVWSHGIPRVIHAICDNALMLGLSENSRRIGVQQIQLACQELHLETPGVPEQFSRDRLDSQEESRDIEEHPPFARAAAVGGVAAEVRSARNPNRADFAARSSAPTVEFAIPGLAQVAPSTSQVASEAPSSHAGLQPATSWWNKWKGLVDSKPIELKLLEPKVEREHQQAPTRSKRRRG